MKHNKGMSDSAPFYALIIVAAIIAALAGLVWCLMSWAGEPPQMTSTAKALLPVLLALGMALAPMRFAPLQDSPLPSEVAL
jgi:hypothetical protein